MMDAHLHLSIGRPSIVALVGILVSVGYFVPLNSRISRLADKIEMLTGKLADVYHRMVRIDDKLGIQPR